MRKEKSKLIRKYKFIPKATNSNLVALLFALAYLREVP
jgi:hypothetical protein